VFAPGFFEALSIIHELGKGVALYVPRYGYVPSLARKYPASLKELARDKHLWHIRRAVIDKEKKFNDTGTW
jgi:hypothetical protein